MRPAWVTDPIVSLVTPPATPIEADDVKAHLRIAGDDQDETITALAKAALSMVDGHKKLLGRALLTQSWSISVSAPNSAGAIFLPCPPFQELTEITYYDADGEEQTATLDEFRVTSGPDWAFVTPRPGYRWPTTESRLDAITIEYTCGYAATFEKLPDDLQSAVRLLTGHFFENREATTAQDLKQLPFGVQALLGPYVLGFYG